jgi:hypothetical protein
MTSHWIANKILMGEDKQHCIEDFLRFIAGTSGYVSHEGTETAGIWLLCWHTVPSSATSCTGNCCQAVCVYILHRNELMYRSEYKRTLLTETKRQDSVDVTLSSLWLITFWFITLHIVVFDPLTPKDPCRGRTEPLTSKRCILYIYSTSIGTEYFKHSIYSPFFLFKMQFVS